MPNAFIPCEPDFLARVFLCPKAFVLNSYSKLPVIAEEKELHYPELESPEGKQRWPEMGHCEEKKHLKERFFFFLIALCW